jgi:hypothetical protein
MRDFFSSFSAKIGKDFLYSFFARGEDYMRFRLPRDESSLAFQLLRTHSCHCTSPSVKHQIAKPISTDDRALPHCLLSRGLSIVANAMLWAIISI